MFIVFSVLCVNVEYELIWFINEALTQHNFRRLN